MAKRIFIVNSVKGGCGKSTVSLHLARYLQTHRRKPVIIDLDLCGSTWSGRYGYALIQDEKKLAEKKTSDDFIFINNMLYNAEKYLKRNYFFEMSMLAGLQRQINDINGIIVELKNNIHDANTQIDNLKKALEEGQNECILPTLNVIKNHVEVINSQAHELDKDLLTGAMKDTYIFDNKVFADLNLAIEKMQDFVSSAHNGAINKEIEDVLTSTKSAIDNVKKIFIPNTLNLVLCDSQNLISLSNDDLELLESLVFKIVKQCWVHDYCLKNVKAEGFTDIIFDLPPGYEKHAEQIIRHLIMDLNSPLYKYLDKNKERLTVESYLCMVSNVDEASIRANIDFVEHIKFDRIDSTDPTKIKNGFFVFNDANHKIKNKNDENNLRKFADPLCSDKLIPPDQGSVFELSQHFEENYTTDDKKGEIFIIEDFDDSICKNFDAVFDSIKLPVD